MYKAIIISLSTFIFTTSSRSQHLEGIYIGRHLDQTVEQARQKEYKLKRLSDQYAEFQMKQNGEEKTAKLYASPQSKTVWFGTVSFCENRSRSGIKRDFRNMSQAFRLKYGTPCKIRKKEIVWDNGYEFVILEQNKDHLLHTLVSTSAFCKTTSEYKD
jgi:hypothetical protein